MEQRVSRSPNFPASQTPENHQSRLREDPFYPRTHRRISLTRANSDQAIESAFSRLTISPDFQAQRETSSPINLPPTLDDFEDENPVPFQVDFGERQENIVELQQALWAEGQSRDGRVNGPFGLEIQRNINVGPKMMCLGKSLYLDGVGVDPLRLMEYQGHGVYDTVNVNNIRDYSYLHGKKPISGSNPECPNFMSSYNNFMNFSSGPSLYDNQNLYQSLPELRIENFRGRIVSLAKDQIWSGILILKLDDGLTMRGLEMVLSEVLEFLSDLMKNQFGSHFVQKLFMVCDMEQRSRIIFTLSRSPSQLINTCLNLYGSKAVQKLLEKLTPQQIFLMISHLSLGVVALANDPNGQHVMQYCLKHFPSEYNKDLLNETAINCFAIATNKSGCCVMQSCVEHSWGEMREWIIHNIIANAVHLAEDPYGNYVVQHLLAMKIPEVTADLVRRFEGNFLSLSLNKYASNVVEKFLETSGEDHCRRITIELITSPNASMLLVDPFGNFVIQSALSVAKGHVRDALLSVIQSNLSSMRSNLYGKKILTCLEKRKISLV